MSSSLLPKDFAIKCNSLNFAEYIQIFKVLGYNIYDSYLEKDYKLEEMHDQIIVDNNQITSCGTFYVDKHLPNHKRFNCIDEFLTVLFKDVCTDLPKWTIRFENIEEKQIFINIIDNVKLFSLAGKIDSITLFMNRCIDNYIICDSDAHKNKNRYSPKEFFQLLWETKTKPQIKEEVVDCQPIDCQPNKKLPKELPTNWTVKLTKDDNFEQFKQKLRILGYPLNTIYENSTGMDYNDIICCQDEVFRTVESNLDLNRYIVENKFESVNDFWEWFKKEHKEEKPTSDQGEEVCSLPDDIEDDSDEDDWDNEYEDSEEEIDDCDDEDDEDFYDDEDYIDDEDDDYEEDDDPYGDDEDDYDDEDDDYDDDNENDYDYNEELEKEHQNIIKKEIINTVEKEKRSLIIGLYQHMMDFFKYQK